MVSAHVHANACELGMIEYERDGVYHSTVEHFCDSAVAEAAAVVVADRRESYAGTPIELLDHVFATIDQVIDSGARDVDHVYAVILAAGPDCARAAVEAGDR